VPRARLGRRRRRRQVLPSLREHREEVLLRELYQRWCNHKLMVRWLSRFFNYLDRWGGGGQWRDAGGGEGSKRGCPHRLWPGADGFTALSCKAFYCSAPAFWCS
jgi:hypothetical protein